MLMNELLQRLIGLSNRLAMDQYTDTHSTMQLVIRATERIQELEAKLMGHLVFKSQTPTTNPDMEQTIAQGLGESILEHHPIQYTEHGTAGFVEVRVLDAAEPPIEQEGSDE